MFVGIILPRDLKPDLETEFSEVLLHYAIIRDSKIVENMSFEEKKNTSKKISEFLVKSKYFIYFKWKKAFL